MKRIWRENSLSIVMLGMFFVAFIFGQAYSGWLEDNEDRVQHGQSALQFSEYLTSAHFAEATMENWESEFLQMGVFVLFTVFLYQKGSAESKDPGKREEVDRDPRKIRDKRNAPWPVRRGGWVLTLYENSLSLAFFLLFLISFLLHVVSGRLEYNEEQIFAWCSRRFARWLYVEQPFLVRIVPELAERIPCHRLHGRLQHLPAAKRLAGIQASGCAAFRNGQIGSNSPHLEVIA